MLAGGEHSGWAGRSCAGFKLPGRSGIRSSPKGVWGAIWGPGQGGGAPPFGCESRPHPRCTACTACSWAGFEALPAPSAASSEPLPTLWITQHTSHHADRRRPHRRGRLWRHRELQACVALHIPFRQRWQRLGRLPAGQAAPPGRRQAHPHRPPSLPLPQRRVTSMRRTVKVRTHGQPLAAPAAAGGLAGPADPPDPGPLSLGSGAAPAGLQQPH